MIGDSADNIAGVPGVGKKTAASLLQTYGSLEGIHEHLDDLQGKKTGQALAEHWDRVERNVRMVRLNLDIPCEDNLEAWAARTPDASCLLSLFERLGFEQFAKNLREPELFDC